MKLLLSIFALVAVVAAFSPPDQQILQEQEPLINITASSFWLENIKHEGLSPFYGDGTSWKVFRNVKDYGAIGDGNHDDTTAIQNAITDGNRASHPGGVTGTPALVYIPGGTYKISSSLWLTLQTSLVGNPNDMPVIKPTDSVGANYVIEANDHRTQGTNNFYISIRNIKIDTTGISPSTQVKALNWGVSQATSLTNVEIVMPTGTDCQHTGIVMVDFQNVGLSNTMFGDLRITGGQVGIAISGQQLLIKSVRFYACTTAIKINSHYLLVLQGMVFDTCGTGVDNTNAASGLSLIDSVVTNSGPALKTPDTSTGEASVMVENLQVRGGENTAIVNGDTKVYGNVRTWVHGNVFVDNSNDLTKNHIQRGIQLDPTNRPPRLLRSDGSFFVKKMPQYENVDASSFASVKSFGAKGDGKTDDTAAIQQALNSNANSKVTYFPHGVYLVTKTVTVPSGSRLAGEVWSVISGSGAYFGDAKNPKPIVQIGAPGSFGSAELTDLLVTINDILPGAILIQVNMAGTNQGDVSLHSTLTRVGGTTDSNVNNVCNTSPAQCQAGFLMIHLTSSSSAYLENIWSWTADHSVEAGTLGPGNSVYVATGRGILIESNKPTWLLGLAPEHQTLYGLNLNNAANLYIAMAQIETPYWQPKAKAPAPWTVNPTFGDPNFRNCDGSDNDCYKAWGMRVSGGSNILVYGIATWTFFENFNGDWSDMQWQACQNEPGRYCQRNAYALQNQPKNSYFYGLATKKVRNMVVTAFGGGERVLAHEASNPAGWGGHVVAYLGFTGS